MEQPESEVYGLLFEMNEIDLETIRKKEGFPDFYGEIEVAVNHEGKSIPGVTR